MLSHSTPGLQLVAKERGLGGLSRKSHVSRLKGGSAKFCEPLLLVVRHRPAARLLSELLEERFVRILRDSTALRATCQAGCGIQDQKDECWNLAMASTSSSSGKPVQPASHKDVQVPLGEDLLMCLARS